MLKTSKNSKKTEFWFLRGMELATNKKLHAAVILWNFFVTSVGLKKTNGKSLEQSIHIPSLLYKG